jgi:hypothetical protein
MVLLEMLLMIFPYEAESETLDIFLARSKLRSTAGQRVRQCSSRVMARHFVLYIGATISSFGLGMWQVKPGVIINVVYVVVKVLILSLGF